MNAALIFLVLTAQLGSQEDQGIRNCFGPNGAIQTYVQAYYECVRMNAARLEPSGATADEIATATTNACRPSQNQAENLADLCQTAFSDVVGPNFATQVRGVIRDGAREVAVTAVVEARAAKTQ